MFCFRKGLRVLKKMANLSGGDLQKKLIELHNFCNFYFGLEEEYIGDYDLEDYMIFSF